MKKSAFLSKKMICSVLSVIIAGGCAGSSTVSTQASDTVSSTTAATAPTEESSVSEDYEASSDTAETEATETSVEEIKIYKHFSAYQYEDVRSFNYPVTDEEHTHIGFKNVDAETEELIKEKLTNAKIIYDVLEGRVPRDDDIDLGLDFRAISKDYFSVDELREICADTFSEDVSMYVGSFSDSVPEEYYLDEKHDGEKKIHEYLDLYIETRMRDGYFCPDPYYTIEVMLSSTAAEAENFGDRIEAVICTKHLIEKENEDKTAVINQTVYTHSKMVMKKIGGKWYITTLEYPLGKELLFQAD